MCITRYHVVLVRRKNAHVHNCLPHGKGPPLTPNQGERKRRQLILDHHLLSTTTNQLSTIRKYKRHTACRPHKLRMWSDESMLGAMNAVAEGKMGINRAALEFGVSPTTLKDRITGRVVHGSKSGPKPYLTHEEET